MRFACWITKVRIEPHPHNTWYVSMAALYPRTNLIVTFIHTLPHLLREMKPAILRHLFSHCMVFLAVTNRWTLKIFKLASLGEIRTLAPAWCGVWSCCLLRTKYAKVCYIWKKIVCEFYFVCSNRTEHARIGIPVADHRAEAAASLRIFGWFRNSDFVDIG